MVSFMKHTIQEVTKLFINDYLNKYTPTYDQKKVLNKILSCRTEELGSHIYQCDKCGETFLSYNSCKDRHCPNCQDYRKEVWIENHKSDILNISYFHIVLTVPSELHVIFYHNQREMYSLLLQCASETIMELASDDKYLGAKVGITAMLHTWSQKANYHPHVHMIVTGGGINDLGKWVNSKEDFFLPIKVISRKFRGKLLSKIKELNLKFYNNYEYLNDYEQLKNYLSPLYDKEWVCYCKEPPKNVDKLYEYLGRYAFRVCMSNERIVKIENGYVYFTYKDRKEENVTKITKLKGEEFIRKFLLHVLPKSFMKVRYYGLMAGKNKTERIKKLRILTKTTKIYEKFKSKIELLNKINGKDVTKCPKCNGNLILISATIGNKSPPYSKVNERITKNA